MIRYILIMLKVGLLGFGGGSALIPVIESEFQQEWKDEGKKAFDRNVLLASITPGALPINLAGSIGRFAYGRIGMLCCALAMALPGAALAYVLFAVLHREEETVVHLVETALMGISAFIFCCLIRYIRDVILKSQDKAAPDLWKTVLVIVVVAILSGESTIRSLLGIGGAAWFGVSTAYILAAALFVAAYGRGEYTWKRLAVMIPLCLVFFLGNGDRGMFSDTVFHGGVQLIMVILAIYGLGKGLTPHRQRVTLGGRELLKDLGVWAVFLLLVSLPALILCGDALEFIGKGVLSALISFGGGDAYLTIADGIFVDSGMVEFDDFYGEIIGVVNVLPGSILSKTLLGVGYYNAAGQGALAASAMALAGLGVAIATSGSAFAVIQCFYGSLESSRAFRIVTRWIRPIVSGLLISVMLKLLAECIAVQADLGASTVMILAFLLVLTLVNLAASLRWKVSGLLALMDIAAAFLLLY